MSRYASRKYLNAVLAEIAFIAALGACLYNPALRVYVPYFVAGIIAIVVGYNTANVWRSGGLGRPPSDM